MQKHTLPELYASEDLGRLNPQAIQKSQDQFLWNFDWTNSTLNEQTIASIENLLVQINDIFARYRIDIGINEDFKIKLTPIDDRAAYSQSLPAPLNLKEDILVDLALLQKHRVITTLPTSKYAGPVFAQRKTSKNGRSEKNQQPHIWRL